MLTQTTAWGPLADFERIGEQIQHLLDTASDSPASEFPALNVWTHPDHVVITADLPGVTPQEIDIAVQGNAFVLRGARTPDPVRDGEVLLRQERLFGRFERALRLPYHVDADRIEARLEKGVLKVTLPRAEADKPRRIAVQAG
jgi:HSP20 family protein